jgi:hypothetical protein
MNTLAASFKVEPIEGGQALMPSFDSKFYRSKKEQGVIIQKRSFRLGSIGERREIKQAGRFKSFKKVNFGGLF